MSYKITNERLLSCVRRLVQNVSLHDNILPIYLQVCSFRIEWIFDINLIEYPSCIQQNLPDMVYIASEKQYRDASFHSVSVTVRSKFIYLQVLML